MSEFVRQVKRLSKPIVSRLGKMDIEMTERCNNNCVHCCINRPVNDFEAKTREMTTDQVKDILGQAADLGCLEVRFTGGEPMLRPDFEELYLYARQLGLRVMVFTNACLITPRLADLFVRIPPKAMIEITFYGMHRESYEAVTRTPGSYSRFRRGVDLLLERRVPFVAKFARLPANSGELGEFEAWARDFPWVTVPRGSTILLELRHRRDDPERNRVITSLRPSAEEDLATLTSDAAGYIKRMREFALKFTGPKGNRLFPCGAGRGVSVDTYGRAQPCMGVRAPELTHDLIGGNGRLTLEQALDQFVGLSELRTTEPQYLERCGLCFLRGVCGQCPAKSWAEHGTLDTPVEYLCGVAHAQARWLGWLNENERGWEVREWRARVSRTPVVDTDARESASTE